MSIFTDDIISFKSVLRLAYNFLAGREYLKKKKFKDRKKLISVALPFSDLIYSAGAVPVFPIRMEKFKVNAYLNALNSAKSLIGWDLTTRLLSFVRQFDVLKILDTVMDDVIHTINEKYNELYELGIDNGIPSDFCYGITGLTGMFISKGKNVDANLNFTIRCSAWNKYSESLKNYVPRQIWVDVPPREYGNAIELLTDNISKAITDLEDVTGNLVTDNSLKKQFRIGNQIKRFYKTVLFECSASDFYPCNPATFAEILALLGLSFQDYNSNAQRYLENFSYLVKEMRERIDKGIGMDVSDMPRVMITPVFGGWEPETHEILYNLGARTIYADWELLKMLEEIPVGRNSNPVEDYARFVMNATMRGIGCDQETLTDSYIETAKDLNVDGLVFNQVFGCHSISNCYSQLRRKIRKKLEIPTTVINFNKIGENVEQVRTRLGAFMEMFR
ncbi:MAG: 2-hydroxyglutaryl-CoA dehydratase, D-component [Promethearchaeota archaeon]|nr:MAG: 2-hydroxyglutaryl-CoA dehydratase, D-component [Candidatus Lokiarchaeota archaeon]